MSNEFGEVKIVDGTKTPQYNSATTGVMLLNFLKQQLGFTKKAAVCCDCKHWTTTKRGFSEGRCNIVTGLSFKTLSTNTCKRFAAAVDVAAVDTDEQRAFKELLVAAELAESVDVSAVLSVLSQSYREQLLEAAKALQPTNESTTQDTVNECEEENSIAIADEAQVTINSDS